VLCCAAPYYVLPVVCIGAVGAARCTLYVTLLLFCVWEKKTERVVARHALSHVVAPRSIRIRIRIRIRSR